MGIAYLELVIVLSLGVAASSWDRSVRSARLQALAMDSIERSSS